MTLIFYLFIQVWTQKCAVKKASVDLLMIPFYIPWEGEGGYDENLK
jgi:hypothetical protein